MLGVVGGALAAAVAAAMEGMAAGLGLATCHKKDYCFTKSRT